MHTVHVLTHSIHGGGQQVVYTLLETLQRRSVNLKSTVVLPPGGVYVERFRRLGIDVVEFATDKLAPFTLRRFRRVLRKLQPDVVHSHGKGAGFFVRASSSRPRFKRIHSFHGFHPPTGAIPRLAYLLLEDHLLRRTDSVIAVSESERQEVLKNFAIPDDRIVAVPNVVNLQGTVEAAQQPLDAEVERFLKCTGEKFVVSMVARNDAQKNYPLAFAATTEVLSRNAGVAFVFVGPGSDDPTLSDLAKAYPDRVFGVPLLENPLPLIRRSHVVLLTSHKEGCPIVLLEAFCLGKPVVATDVQGIRDVVQDGVDGILTGEDHRLIAQSIIRLTTDEALYRKLSRGALQRGRGMDVTEWAATYLRLYDLLVGKT